MAKIATIYFSGYGHTKKLAEAVHEGAGAASGATATLIAIDKEGNLPEDDWQTLDQADAILFGSPTYMGGPAWQFKKFADASSKRWMEMKWKDKIAGGFTNSASTNGDKFNTLIYFFTLSQQHGQIWVGTGLLPANKKENSPSDINWTAGFSGVMSISPADASPDEAPRQGDLETAKVYGKRVAEYAVRTRG
jgi:NAD(P)H dehydrogenase (quinone)